MTDKAEVKETFWHDGGELKSIENSKNGLPHGQRRRWDENGQLTNEEYLIEGKLHGTQSTWYSNGQISIEVNYKNDKRHC